MTDTHTGLAGALAVLQTRLPVIKRSERAVVPTKTGGTYTYTYADLANISEQILPVLGELGLSFSARPTLNTEGKFVLAYELLHTSGEMRTGEFPLSGTTPQAIGSAITYARRYTLCAITGLAPDEDDDAAAAEAASAGQRGTAQRAATRPRPDATARPAATERTAQRATAAPPPLPGETNGAISPAQQKMLHAQLRTLGLTERDAALARISLILRRDVESTKDLTKVDATTVIDELLKESEPA